MKLLILKDICQEYTKSGHHANGLKIATTANALHSPNLTAISIAHALTKSMAKIYLHLSAVKY
jgi:hypothetical protein